VRRVDWISLAQDDLRNKIEHVDLDRDIWREQLKIIEQVKLNRPPHG
jgi:hypothetical protein